MITKNEACMNTNIEEALLLMGIKMYMVISALVTSIIMTTTKINDGTKPLVHFVHKIMGGVLAIIITPGICAYFKLDSPEIISFISVVLTITSMPIVIYINKNGQTLLTKLTDKFLK